MLRYRGDNGQYEHQDNKYQHQDSGGSGRTLLVNIGGNRPPATKAKTTPTPPPPPPPPAPPAPPIFFIDPRRNGIFVNQEEPINLGAAAADIKILRQEQEETESGYRYV